MQAEEELVEVALLRYAHEQAAKWGADRFAAEFARRELEEQWLEASRQKITPYGPAEEPADEVVPSIDGLTRAGYPPADTFAFPFGDTSDEITAAVLRIVPRVRVSPGSCPK